MPPRVCVDKTASSDQMVARARTSIHENPFNVSLFPRRMFRAHNIHPEYESYAMGLVPESRWLPGRTIRISFLNGSETIRERIKHFAIKWLDHANLNFHFVSNGPADVRIAIKWKGDNSSWSKLGVEALMQSDQDEPTMNFGWLTPTTRLEEYSSVVLHEFGHALGCIHEHQHPRNGIPWNIRAVYNYYMGPPNNWSKERVDFNIFETYSENKTQFSKLDKDSIMMYPIDPQLTNGNFSVGWNTELSPTDKSFIGIQYPFEPKRAISIKIGESAEGDIGRHGEEDLFRFSVTREARYIVETHGDTDVVMGLFGPDDQTKLVEEDDDGGRRYNARIEKSLETGTYYLRVRHNRPTGAGKYNISITREH